jgi:cell division protein FtsL
MSLEKPENKKRISTGSFMKELLSGGLTTKIILKNLWYIMLITSLAAIYIANRFHAEKITRDITRMQREVRELRAESLSISAELMFVSRQSEVYKLVKERGLDLEELKVPAFKLIVDK